MGAKPTKKQRQKIKSFVKLESYPTFKEARWINSRSDEFKVYCGPAIKAIEHMLYELPEFIKHVPVPDRPQKILGLKNSGLRYYENDFKAFESLFVPELMDVLECQLYRFCLQAYPELRDEICNAATGTNKLRTRLGVWLELMGKRMSGDMFTSLGNGFSNLMLAKFIAFVKGGSLTGFVEGDDGLFATTVNLSALDYSDLGFEVEIKELTDPTKGHFCGMTMGAQNEILKDPRRVFQNFGWTSSFIGAGNAVMDGLLRSKALSLLYEMPNCPIVGVLARTALEITSGVDAIEHRELYLQSKSLSELTEHAETRCGPFTPSPEARDVMKELFGIEPEVQLAVEAAIERHDMQFVADLLPPSSENQFYYERYLEFD